MFWAVLRVFLNVFKDGLVLFFRFSRVFLNVFKDGGFVFLGKPKMWWLTLQQHVVVG